jgi:RNA-binding protein 5/10
VRPHLTGESDTAPSTAVPTHILVVYPLTPDLSEARLAEELRRLEMDPKPEIKETPGKLKSTAPSGNTSRLGGRPGSLHRVFLMRDRDTHEALRYGFAEFWTAQDAAAALAKYTKAPLSFTVAGTPIAAAATHTGVFVPEQTQPEPGEEHFSFSPLFNPALRVRYWEPTVYASARVVAAESPDAPNTKDEADGAVDAKKSKKRKADGGLPASSAKKQMPMSSQVAMWQKKSAELRTDKIDGRNAPTIKISLSADAALALAGPPASAAPADAPRPEVSFVDRERLCCLLCMMKYKSVEDVDKHERLRNHKTAMEDADKVKAATARLAKQRKSETPATTTTLEGDQETTQQQYRDRAKERREAFNQPNRPALISSAKPTTTTTAATTSTKPTTPTSIPTPPTTITGTPTPTPTLAPTPAPAAAPKISKGSAMLAKMGWTAGKGLGADGAGRTTIVETHAYQEGVGLGAEGGDLGDAAALAESRTRNSYADYVNTVQDKARARYNQLS